MRKSVNLKKRKEEKSKGDFNSFEIDPKKKEEIIEHLKRSFAMSPDDIQELRSQIYNKVKEEENLAEEDFQSNKDKSEDEEK